uniref:Uncharacterized protein n=1 Tax=Globodera rostochiensis TaxID=31243 RepID=A0A914H143_GLORO
MAPPVPPFLKRAPKVDVTAVLSHLHLSNDRAADPPIAMDIEPPPPPAPAITVSTEPSHPPIRAPSPILLVSGEPPNPTDADAVSIISVQSNTTAHHERTNQREVVQGGGGKIHPNSRHARAIANDRRCRDSLINSAIHSRVRIWQSGRVQRLPIRKREWSAMALKTKPIPLNHIFFLNTPNLVPLFPHCDNPTAFVARPPVSRNAK